MGNRLLCRWFYWVFAAVILLAAGGQAKAKTGKEGHRLSGERIGSLPTRPGLRLKLVTDLGNVAIRHHSETTVDYRVRIETDSSNPDAQKLLDQFSVTARELPEGVYLRGQSPGRGEEGELWVTFEVNVPTEYSVEVSTQGGNVSTEDVGGRAILSTAGGNISTGNIRAPAHLSTDGGHIIVGDVSGDLFAGTGGGHITTGHIAGNALLHTGGGHIRVASVGGLARVDTGGGNISFQHAGTELIAETGGGQIQVGEAAGIVRAKTGGGGIRVVRVAGPTSLETAGGSIYLTRVESPVRASTGAGGITAWFGPDAKLHKPCELESGQGDIVVYLPRQLAITIDAVINMGDEHHFIADPAFPLKVTYAGGSGGAHVVRANGDLNGGGEILHLRTVAGNIRLVLSDAAQQLQIYQQQMEQLQRQLKSHLHPHDSDEGRKKEED
jgi:hypothetical protein